METTSIKISLRIERTMMTDEDRIEKIDRVRSGTDKMFDDKMDINLRENRRNKIDEKEEVEGDWNHNIALKDPMAPRSPLI